MSVLCYLRSVSHWVVVANDDQVLVFPASNRALVQRVNDAHVCLLFEAQDAALVELHAVAAVRTDADHRPYDQSDLRARADVQAGKGQHLQSWVHYQSLDDKKTLNVKSHYLIHF